MSYYRTCPYCGSHLDPCERCDCIEVMYDRLTPENKMKVNTAIDVLLARQTENAAPSATNTWCGKVEQSTTAVSASIVNENEEDFKR